MAEKKKRNILKELGSLTMAPYVLKSAKYGKLADAMGYPFEDDGSRKPDSEIETSISSRTRRGEKIKAPKYEDDPMTLAREALGFKSGGMVRGCKGVQTSGKGFKGTY